MARPRGHPEPRKYSSMFYSNIWFFEMKLIKLYWERKKITSKEQERCLFPLARRDKKILGLVLSKRTMATESERKLIKPKFVCMSLHAFEITAGNWKSMFRSVSTGGERETSNEVSQKSFSGGFVWRANLSSKFAGQFAEMSWILWKYHQIFLLLFKDRKWVNDILILRRLTFNLWMY